MTRSPERPRITAKVLAAVVAAGLAAPLPATAQTLSKCNIGEQVTDNEGGTGIIVGAQAEVCQLRYPDGQTRAWASWSLHPALAGPPPPVAGEGTVVLRGSADEHQRVYRADSRGHFTIAATANGAPIRFLVDTGATLVFMTPSDAQAAGVDPGSLSFSQTANTSNGQVKVAPFILQQVQVDDITVEHVPAGVIDGLSQSVLGMSFLARLKSFEIKGGALTLDW
jgi:clan AA aspartic protease (TIGR02281 family)